MKVQESQSNHILLADDDDDDRLLFLDVLREITSGFQLTTAKNGEQLMALLYNLLPKLPDLIFLDLNMPRKNGFECLEEIKRDKKFKHLPVIIFSTSSQPNAVNQVYEGGASLYIRKPSDFTSLKRVIQYVLNVNWQKKLSQPPKEEFVLGDGGTRFFETS